MTTHDDEPLDDDARTALDRLRRPLQPPPGLEARVIAAVGVKEPGGALHPVRRRRWGALAGTLAAAATFIVGMWLGLVRPWEPRAPASGATSRFILLLYEDATYEAPADPAARTKEYADWAGALGRRGIVIGGDELGSGGAVITRAAAPEPLPAASIADLPAGYFIIEARDDADAARIAASCPHVAHGGRIVIRRIVT